MWWGGVIAAPCLRRGLTPASLALADPLFRKRERGLFYPPYPLSAEGEERVAQRSVGRVSY
jgi:hypothetical protein